MPSGIKDKNNEQIKEGDDVWTRVRGGKHEGQVRKIVSSEAEANKEGVKHPPKVLFTDQHGHHVAHNPGTLQHVEKEREKK